MLKVKNKNFIFAKLFLSYFFILIIPLITCSLVYYESIQIGTEDAKSQNMLMLAQVKGILDSRLEEIQTILHQIATDERVIAVLNVKNYTEGSPDCYKIRDLCNNIPNYKLTNQMILESYIFLKGNNIVISSTSAYFSANTLYGKAFSYGKMNYSEWNNFLWKTFYRRKYLPTSEISINGIKNPAICYMQSLPYETVHNTQGVVAIMINEKAIENMLQRFDIGSTGMVYISDSEGNVVSCLSGKNCKLLPGQIQASISNKKQSLLDNVTVSMVKSDFNQWNYVSVIPAEIILSKVQYIKKLMLIMFFVSLILGGVAAFLLTYRKANILAAVTDRFGTLFGTNSQSNTNRDAFKFIDTAVSELIHNNLELEKSVKEQAPLLEAALLRSLLYGEMSDTMGKNVPEIFIGTENSQILVATIWTESQNAISENGTVFDDGRKNVLIKDLVNRSVGKRHFLLDIKRNTIVMLVVFDDQEADTAKFYMNKTLDKMLEFLEKSLNIGAYFALSDFHQGVNSANAAFEESNNVIDYMHFYKNHKVIWYSEIPKESEFYYYPVDVELRLIGMVKSGDTGGVKKTIQDIYVENFEKRQLSSEMLQQLMNSMKGTVIRGLGSMSYDQTVHEFINELYKATTIDEIFNSVVRANVRISMVMNNLRENNQNTLKEKVLAYVGNHYQENELTLEQLADSLGYTECFMYQFFKDSVGLTFANYLENFRINRACEFLAYNDAAIKDVSEKIGYNSDHSFRRAFKRIMGVSPSEYIQATHSIN